MKYRDLREFLDILEKKKQLKRIGIEIDPFLEITEISDRVLRQQGPALFFSNPKQATIPIITNLFGTKERVALGLGLNDPQEIKDLGKILAFLKEPEPPKGLKDAFEKWPLFKKAFNMSPKL